MVIILLPVLVRCQINFKIELEFWKSWLLARCNKQIELILTLKTRLIHSLPVTRLTFVLENPINVDLNYNIDNTKTKQECPTRYQQIRMLDVWS